MPMDIASWRMTTPPSSTWRFPVGAAGFPRLKGYPDIAGTLGYDAASLEAMHDSQKKSVPTRHGICRESGAL